MNANTSHPDLNPVLVREGLEIIHRQAAAALVGVERPGYLQLVRIHPVGGKAIATSFVIGDVDGMTAQTLADAAAGFNVYVETRTVNEASYGRGRGKAADTRAVFAFVVDSDADKGKSCHVDAEPSLIVESSPGNAHLWFFVQSAITAEEAGPIGEAMRTATGTDSGTGNVTQPFRVPGTPNYPGPAKQARGRVVSPTRILSVSGTLWTPERLREAFRAQQEQQRNGKSSGGPETGWFTVEPILAEIATPSMDRSARFHAAVRAAVRGVKTWRGGILTGVPASISARLIGCARRSSGPGQRSRLLPRTSSSRRTRPPNASRRSTKTGSATAMTRVGGSNGMVPYGGATALASLSSGRVVSLVSSCGQNRTGSDTLPAGSPSQAAWSGSPALTPPSLSPSMPGIRTHGSWEHLRHG